CNAFAEPPRARAFSGDIAAALEYVYERRTQHEIASVNMSLGSGLSSTSCDALVPDISDVINSLKAARIATVVASGNSSSRSAISFPACISAASAVRRVGSPPPGDPPRHGKRGSRLPYRYGEANTRRAQWRYCHQAEDTTGCSA